MRDGKEGIRVDEAVLRRLIAEGSRAGAGFRNAPGQPSDSSLRALAAALDAVAAPPGPGELKGEEAALAAFRAACTERADVPATGLRGRLARLARRLGRTRTSALGVVVAAVLGSGVAVASGGMPFLPKDAPEGTTTGASPSPGTTPPPASPGATGTESGPEGRRAGPSGPGADGIRPSTASSRLVALCRSHQKDPDTVPRKPLADAAGGGERIDAYCAEVLEAATARPDSGDGQENGQAPDGNPGGNSGNGNPGNGVPATPAEGNQGNGNGNPGNGNQGGGDGGGNGRGNNGNGNPGDAGQGTAGQGNGNRGGNDREKDGRGAGNQGNGNGDQGAGDQDRDVPPNAPGAPGNRLPADRR